MITNLLNNCLYLSGGRGVSSAGGGAPLAGWRWMDLTAKTFSILLYFSFFAGNIFAQDSTATLNKNVTVKQDVKIFDLLSKYHDYNSSKEFTEGYRIQITYTNIREDIYKDKGQMYKDFPQLPSYVEYEQPYYKLRLGDFKTRLEASYYLQQVTALHPGAFIVKDKVKIR